MSGTYYIKVRGGVNLKGIDVSSFQTNLDFVQAKASGYVVAFIKATEGLNYTNPAFKDQYNKAKANGFKVGFYHFLKDTNPVDEAKHFLSAISGLQSDCKYVIDAETNFNGVSLHVRQFADYLISQGKEPMLYSGLYFYNNSLDNTVKDLPLWVAAYGQTRPAVNSVGWQYSESGNIGGVTVDLDEFENGIFLTINISYKAHVQSIGWQAPVSNGAIAGTVGKSLRMEAIVIDSKVLLTYKAHVQNIGWQAPVSNGAIAGTVGKSLRMEAITIQSNDPAYSIRYKAHVQNIGWSDWVYDGAVAGTVGKSLRLEAVQIELIKK